MVDMFVSDITEGITRHRGQGGHAQVRIDRAWHDPGRRTRRDARGRRGPPPDGCPDHRARPIPGRGPGLEVKRVLCDSARGLTPAG